MKKLLSLMAVSLFCFIGSANAQKTHVSKTQMPYVEFGLKAGLNVTDIHGPTTSFDTKVSAFGGGLAHIHLSEQIAVQPELVYSGQGAKQGIGGSKFTFRLNYINVPLLFQYMILDGLRLQTGPQLGLLLSARIKSENNTTSDIKDKYSTADFAWIFGAGYLFPSGFGFDARYNLGISNINVVGDYNRNKLQNRVFQLGIFYQFVR